MYFYQFVRSTGGTLKFISLVNIKYLEHAKTNGYVVFTSDEIKSVKDNFKVEKNRIVKSGRTWMDNDFTKKMLIRNFNKQFLLIESEGSNG